jgi:hypothetical protein
MTSKRSGGHELKDGIVAAGMHLFENVRVCRNEPGFLEVELTSIHISPVLLWNVDDPVFVTSHILCI